jgi:hypothetical protein
MGLGIPGDHHTTSITAVALFLQTAGAVVDFVRRRCARTFRGYIAVTRGGLRRVRIITSAVTVSIFFGSGASVVEMGRGQAVAEASRARARCLGHYNGLGTARASIVARVEHVYDAVVGGSLLVRGEHHQRQEQEHNAQTS